MPTVGFENTISEDERPQTYALDGAATGTGTCNEVLEGATHVMRYWKVPHI